MEGGKENPGKTEPFGKGSVARDKLRFGDVKKVVMNKIVCFIFV